MLRRTVLIVAMFLAMPAFAEDRQSAMPRLPTGADALLAIDQQRATVIDRIVNDWGDALAGSNVVVTKAELRDMLAAMRADHLLAASLAGSLSGLRDVIANALTAASDVRARRAQTKALGDSNDDLAYTPVFPCRVADTRIAGGALGANDARDFKVWVSSGGFTGQGGDAGNCNVPANPAAVMLNIAAVNISGLGNLIAYPTGGSLPNTSVLNYQAGTFALSNGAFVPTCVPDCADQISIKTNGAGADVVIDVVGYFKRPSNYGGTHAITGTYATDSGGYNNTASGADSTVGGGDANTASATASAVGGGEGNAASDDFSTVSGGNVNKAIGEGSAVGGGYDNTAGGFGSSISGGGVNTADGDYSGVTSGQNNDAFGAHSVVAGGRYNFALGDSSGVTSGYQNEAAGSYSVVAGGYNNQALADYSIVAGGASNLIGAGGAVSFVAGTLAYAGHVGQFVWSDNTQTRFDPGDGVNNQNGLWFSQPSATFSVRATGGVMLVTGVNGSGYPMTGVTLSPGSGSWASHSDRAVKENFASVDPRRILEKVVELPITSWNYITEGATVRHLGPVSQDFYAAFGLGANEHTITMVDADGVALAAIQGLYQLVKDKDARISALERRLRLLER